MKKITALMLSSAMMLSLAACGGSASTETVSRGCFFRGCILRGRFHRGGRFCRRCRGDHRQRRQADDVHQRRLPPV